MKRQIGLNLGEPRLRTWRDLNDALRAAGEDECLALELLERRGRNRVAFRLRIQARLNRLRGEQARRDILGGGDGPRR